MSGDDNDKKDDPLAALGPKAEDELKAKRYLNRFITIAFLLALYGIFCYLTRNL